MSDDSPRPSEQGATDCLAEIRRRLRTLTVLVAILSLMVALSAAALFGNLLDYFGYEPILWGGVTLGVAFAAFGVGFWVGRKTA